MKLVLRISDATDATDHRSCSILTCDLESWMPSFKKHNHTPAHFVPDCLHALQKVYHQGDQMAPPQKKMNL